MGRVLKVLFNFILLLALSISLFTVFTSKITFADSIQIPYGQKFKDANDKKFKELRKQAPPDAWVVKDKTGVWLEDPKKMNTLGKKESENSYVADDGSIIYPGELPSSPPLDYTQTIEPFSIIGNDELVRQNPTTIYPYSTITYLIPTWNGDNYRCTGFVIGPHTIATAGHCIWDSSLGGYADSVYTAPAKNLSTTPYGVYYPTKLAVLNGYANFEDPELDYGILQLGQDISQMTGTISFRIISGSMNGVGTNITGYPNNPDSYLDSAMMRDIDSVRATYANNIAYGNDTYGGMSGSPIINDSASCNMCAIGIHTTGVGGLSSTWNSGVRMTQTVVNNLNSWKSQ